MKMVMVAVLAAFVFAASLPLAAQQPGRRFERAEPGPNPQRPPAREAAWPARDAHEGHGPGRMSPEERRQLRRDINSHGRDIYREGRGRK